MKVAMIARATLYSNPGGDTVQISNTAKELNKFSVEAHIRLTNENINYNEYDLLHFFNIIRPADILRHTAGTKPFVVSPIFVDYSEFELKQRGGAIGRVTRFLNAESKEYVKAIARYLVNDEKILSTAYLQLPMEVVCGITFRKTNNRYYLFFKRFFDLSFALLFSIFILVWLVPLLALLIKLNSNGPIFFVQKRTGRDGQTFNCIKFRTMLVNDLADVSQALNDDQRITRFGRFLRNTNIDELPQFINVIKGDMSIIGPRPHMLFHTIQFSGILSNYAVRHNTRPGITGLAQVKGWRGPTPTFRSVYKRVQWDIYYASRQSISLNVYIFMHTLREVAANMCISILRLIQGK